MPAFTTQTALPPTRIRNIKLSKMSGVPATVIRDWRRRGFVPKTKHIDTRWIAVVIDVYATETSLKALFKNARRRHGLIRQRTRPDSAIEGERMADMMLPR